MLRETIYTDDVKETLLSVVVIDSELLGLNVSGDSECDEVLAEKLHDVSE